MKILLVVNPKSTNSKITDIKNIVSKLSVHGPVNLFISKNQNDLLTVRQKLIEDKYQILVIAGGDGTINQIINGVLLGNDSNLNLLPLVGIIPNGNANVLAKSLKIPTNKTEALHFLCKTIQADTYTSISLGKANKKYFLFNAGLGFDAQIVKKIEKSRKFIHTAKNYKYFWYGLQELIKFDFNKNRMEIISEDFKTFCTNLIINNGPVWTYNKTKPLVTNPKTNFNTGLGLCMIKNLKNRSEFLRFLFLLNSSKPASNSVTINVVDYLQKFRVNCSSPVSLQLDGEYAGEATHLDVEYLHHAVRLLTN